MGVAEKLLQIKNIEQFAFPKTREMPRFLVSNLHETNEWVYLPCTQVFHFPPDTDANIQVVSDRIGHNFPEQLKEIYRYSNGANLFELRFPFQQESWGEYQHTHYHILNLKEIRKVNHELVEVYRDFAEDELNVPRKNISINYIAFCDVNDGNYLAISLEDEHVFFLDHEYEFYPVGHEATIEAYHFVAATIEDWLDRLIVTNGWDGAGGKYLPL
jgi:hypothetical protein